MATQIELPFGPKEAQFQVANTIEPSICCGDAGLCQITLTTC